jgi:transcriptional regulator with XRE-family HTH domain
MGKTSAPPLDAKRILRARIAKRLTQDQVCAMCLKHGLEITRGHLSRIETGDVKRPNFQIIDTLAKVLGLNDDEIFADEPEPAKAAA